MSDWRSSRARQVLAALFRIGWTAKRQSGSHRTLTKSGFPDFAAFLSHMKFVKNHHQKIKKIAAVTGSSFLSIMPQVANHFIQAEVRHFDYDDKDAALNWLKADK